MSGTQLVLHRGAREVSREAVAQLEAPPPTATWFPVSHIDVLTAVEAILGDSGFAVAKERYALHGDHRMFATIDLTCEVAPDVTLCVGVRNSTNQTFPMGFCAGNRVFVCDNTSFSAELMVAKKHSKFGQDRYRESIAQAVRSLGRFQEAEATRISCMREKPLQDAFAESLLLRSFERGILSHRLLPVAIRNWREPEHNWEPLGSLWHLFNAMTTPLQKRARTNPQQFALKTMQLMGLVSGFVGLDSPVIDITPGGDHVPQSEN